MQRCVVTVRAAEKTVDYSDIERSLTASDVVPTARFTSLGSLAAVLSEDNRALLRVIRDGQPNSLAELAELTGRKVPNLSRTLKTMASYGLVELRRGARGVLTPIAKATSFLVLVD